MVDNSIFIYLLSDNKSLSHYAEGEAVSYEKIKQHLFLLERSKNTTIPDHYYKLKNKREFFNIDSTVSLLSEGFKELSNKYLILDKNGRIFVNEKEFSIWQNLITYIPPLILQSAFIYNKTKFDNRSPIAINSFYQKYLKPNFSQTALPHPKIKFLEKFVTDEKGFNDLHIHLNGSAETDVIWQDFLKSPYLVYKELKNGFEENKVVEQYEQESHLLNPYKFYKLLIIAREIRQLLFNIIFKIDILEINEFSVNQLISDIVFKDNFQEGYQKFKHPFSILINTDDDLNNQNDLAIEALMYVLVFSELNTNKSTGVASIFHFYLLIQGLSNRLLVQQVHQYGFEQFQKHTLNNLRELSEKTYHQRFFQMHGNESRNISFLEGRFSPKKSEIENNLILNSIFDGWEIFNSKNILNKSKLKLIAHFIKKNEDNESNSIRHKRLRVELFNRAEVLILLKKKGLNKHANHIVGIDAAANELDTPPEVFAPIFRMLRNNNVFSHFTYHVGEDFFHIISGLRAIYEAIEFTELKKGDRIGHATATGIDCKLWVNAICETMPIKKGEWLDNLIFVRYVIKKYDIIKLKPLLDKLEEDIKKHINQIYGANYNLINYQNSWLLRKYCPILLFSSDYEEAQSQPTYDSKEWNRIKNKSIPKATLELYRLYHLKSIREKYDEIIDINTNEIFNAQDIEELQLKTLNYLSKKKIIIETLPTSNVRISHYKNYSEYHLFNWNRWQKNGEKIPKIIVGTDDTGIFATNIFNEYAHIYCQFKNNENKAEPLNAARFLKKLHNNGEKYKFI